MPFHEEVLNSEASQEDRSGKTHQGTADDENWYRFRFVSAHVVDVYQDGLRATRASLSEPIWRSAVSGLPRPGELWLHTTDIHANPGESA
jgi:hypothetical protein